ncbi:hypothetical protein LYNGBM3L_63650 [Moorena producens 3L]|uniref:Uncharacterized protein n=1 Tax=Moorena producens 3L TaxID=489825 RepID=F4Y0P9_9CYAN|nr:hypothetical protein LYNGBM3L_63650 [Moorena producens 3L]
MEVLFVFFNTKNLGLMELKHINYAIMVIIFDIRSGLTSVIQIFDI